MATVMVGIVLAVLVFFAVRKIYKDHLLGRCGGDCDSCALSCQHKNPIERLDKESIVSADTPDHLG